MHDRHITPSLVHTWPTAQLQTAATPVVNRGENIFNPTLYWNKLKEKPINTWIRNHWVKAFAKGVFNVSNNWIRELPSPYLLKEKNGNCNDGKKSQEGRGSQSSALSDYIWTSPEHLWKVSPNLLPKLGVCLGGGFSGGKLFYDCVMMSGKPLMLMS